MWWKERRWSLPEQDEIDRLFFELASEDRLSILRTLNDKSLRMQEVGRSLGLTDTEVSRQLHRLSDASLIVRQPEGTFTITPYGRLVLHLIRPLEFVLNNRSCFLTRNVWRLPPEFVDRMGALHDAHLSMNMIEMLNLSEKGASEALGHIWAISDERSAAMDGIVKERLSKGVKLRLIFAENQASLYEGLREVPGLMEKRTLPEIPLNLICTEKSAGVSLPSSDGRPDNALFYGRDSALLKWAGDLFLYYWERADHC